MPCTRCSSDLSLVTKLQPLSRIKTRGSKYSAVLLVQCVHCHSLAIFSYVSLPLVIDEVDGLKALTAAGLAEPAKAVRREDAQDKTWSSGLDKRCKWINSIKMPGRDQVETLASTYCVPRWGWICRKPQVAKVHRCRCACSPNTACPSRLQGAC